ncbi:MAG TPA: hypothetical protein VLK65_06460 [Vicinamibacteria bacterium]|nr:hypothetical protein [Vicinamibacteria bacterium]
MLDALLRCPERHRFFRGLVSWVGFRVASLPFSVNERAGGTSKWSTWSLLRYSVRNLLIFTSLPLRLIAWVGIVVVMISLLLGVQTLYNHYSGRALTGFTTVILLLILLNGLVLISLGPVEAERIHVIMKHHLALAFVGRPPLRDQRGRAPSPGCAAILGSRMFHQTLEELELPERLGEVIIAAARQRFLPVLLERLGAQREAVFLDPGIPLCASPIPRVAVRPVISCIRTSIKMRSGCHD